MIIRVLHVVTHMNRGGLETMIMNYYRHIDRRKIQFDFLVHRNESDYDEEIKSLGGKIFVLPRLNPFSLSYKNELDSFFQKYTEYKIIHVHQDCMSSLILKSAKKHGVPVRIAHCHSSNQDKDFKYIIKLFYKRLISKYATHLFACSKTAGKWMFGDVPFSVLNNAIDAKQYTYDENKRILVRQEFGISQNEILIGHVGRFSTVKNHVFLLDIFYHIQKTVPSKLLLVGDGEQMPDIKKRTGKFEMQDIVIFAGLRSDVADLLQAMDVFVFPSLYEGLPVTLVEAQAAGLNCLVSDRVPIECNITGSVEQISLKESSDYWAEKAIQMSRGHRENTVEIIRQAGFDIIDNAEKLQNFYTSQWNAECLC